MGDASEGWGEEGRWLWVLDDFGHTDAPVLDGGWQAWVSAGGTSTQDTTTPPLGDFTPLPVPAKRVSPPQVVQATPSGTLTGDTREDREFLGATAYGESRGGYIPGAVGLRYSELLGADGRLLPEPELHTLLSGHGLGPQTPIITACSGGVRSGFAYAVLRDLGHTNVANYDGSTWAWSAGATLPMTTARPERPSPADAQ